MTPQLWLKNPNVSFERHNPRYHGKTRVFFCSTEVRRHAPEHYSDSGESVNVHTRRKICTEAFLPRQQDYKKTNTHLSITKDRRTSASGPTDPERRPRPCAQQDDGSKPSRTTSRTTSRASNTTSLHHFCQETLIWDF